MGYSHFDIGHNWAHQLKSRQGDRYYSFNGRKIKSYSTVIGEIVYTKNNTPVYFLNTGSYSNSTCKHQNYAFGAIPKYAVRFSASCDEFMYGWDGIANWNGEITETIAKNFVMKNLQSIYDSLLAFKDSEAYENDWDAPCYSEEACFDDAATTDRYWTHVSILLECGYNEKLCNAMFSELAWQCPDTWLNELDEEDYSYYWSWLKVGCKAFWWLDEWWDADFYEVVRIGDAPEDYNPDTTVWLRKPDEENPGKYEEIEARLWELAETDISRQLQKKKEEYYHSFIKPGAKVWWSDPAGESSDWFYVDSIEDDGYPWGDETEVWLKMNKNDKVATNQVLMQELSITNK